MDFQSTYMFRGIRQHSTGVAAWPWADLGIAAYAGDGAVKSVGSVTVNSYMRPPSFLVNFSTSLYDGRAPRQSLAQSYDDLSMKLSVSTTSDSPSQRPYDVPNHCGTLPAGLTPIGRSGSIQVCI